VEKVEMKKNITVFLFLLFGFFVSNECYVWSNKINNSPIGVVAETSDKVAIEKDLSILEKSFAENPTVSKEIPIIAEEHPNFHGVVAIMSGRGHIMGSGIIWGDNHIITNLHVVRGLKEVFIRFENNKNWYHCDILGASVSKDTAVLHIIEPPEGDYMKSVSLYKGKHEDLLKGQEVYVLGNPMGLGFTLTKGIISALRKGEVVSNLKTEYDAIQVDASINPGNSGGAIFDDKGFLIGMASFIVSRSGGSNGLNFGIFVGEVDKVYKAIISGYEEADTEDILIGDELVVNTNTTPTTAPLTLRNIK
jgi:S1-C subfamily serine protease